MRHLPAPKPDLVVLFTQKLKDYELGHLLPILSPYIESTLGFSPTEPDNYATTGNTRIGGQPDLPANWNWPRAFDEAEDSENSVPGPLLHFALQINLEDIAPYQDVFPKQGLLYFFLDDDFHFPAARVLLYTGDAKALHNRYMPLESPIQHPDAFLHPQQAQIWKGYKLRIRQGLGFPHFEHRLIASQIELNSGDKLRYLDLQHEVSGGVHQMFGYPPFCNLDPRDMEQLDLSGPPPGISLFSFANDPALKMFFPGGAHFSLVVTEKCLYSLDFSAVHAVIDGESLGN